MFGFVVGSGIAVSECRAQTPDPIILLQGVEMARLQVPPSRLHFRLVFRDALRKEEGDYVMEFDGDKRRLAAQTPQGIGLTYDGSEVVCYNPKSRQVELTDISDGLGPLLFDPRTVGMNSGLYWSMQVSEMLPYRHGKVEMVGREKIRGIDTWHVRITINGSEQWWVDVWVRDAEGFPVYRYDETLQMERRTILSYYENKDYPWLPSKVDYSSFNTNGSFRVGLAVTFTKAEAGVAFSETNWTIAALNMPEGTPVIDRRTKLTTGYWNGTNITPSHLWHANQKVKSLPVQPQGSRTVVFALFAATVVFPVLLWAGLRKKRGVHE
jgi:hypothetical protein